MGIYLCDMSCRDTCFQLLKQLEQFKKLVNIIGSGLMILSLFSAPSAMSVMGGQSESVSVNISVGHGIGFWLALICSLGIAGVAIVNFLNLQGNPFLTPSTHRPTERGPAHPHKALTFPEPPKG